MNYEIYRAQIRARRHRHRPASAGVEPFFGPVADPQRPAAHGGCCIVERCACGAVRRTNRNGAVAERGCWVEELAPRSAKEEKP